MVFVTAEGIGECYGNDLKKVMLLLSVYSPYALDDCGKGLFCFVFQFATHKA